MKVRVPTNGSVAILNASAEKGSSSDDDLESISSSSSELFGITPSIALTSSGAGRKSITASKTAWTPLFLNAEPHSANITSFARDLILNPSLIWSGVNSPDSKYASIRSSLASAAASNISSLNFEHLSIKSSGISFESNVRPWSSSFQ